MIDEDDLLTVGEVADRLKLETSTLYSWRFRGVGPRSFKLRGRLVYRLPEVQAWAREQEAATARGGSAA